MMNMQQGFSSALGKDRADQERMRLLLSECQFENNAQQAEFQSVVTQLEQRRASDNESWLQQCCAMTEKMNQIHQLEQML